MKFEIGLSHHAYARHLSVDDKAVRKAIFTGRPAAAVLPDWTIDATLIDILWEAHNDPSQRREKEAVRAEALMRAFEEAAAPALPSGPRRPRREWAATTAPRLGGLRGRSAAAPPVPERCRDEGHRGPGAASRLEPGAGRSGCTPRRTSAGGREYRAPAVASGRGEAPRPGDPMRAQVFAAFRHLTES